MKKLLSKTLALLMCLTLLTGCGSPSGGDNSENDPGNVSGTGDNSGTPTKYEGVKITDNYTFEDPADLSFDTRYVLYMGPTSDLVSVSVPRGQLCQYNIIYAKQDKAVGEYTLYICDTAEHAKSMSEEMSGYGINASIAAQDDTVICAFSDEYALEPSIDIYQMAGVITDTTAAAYAQMYVTAYGAEMKE